NELVETLWMSQDTSPATLPTPKTLTVLANSYGYLGALDTAFTKIQSIARKHNLEIHISTYISLLLWSVRRSARPTNYTSTPKTGNLSSHLPRTLFQKMLSSGIRPGIEAFWIIIRHEYRRR